MPSRPLTENEVYSILGHMTSKRDQCLFLVSLHTGFRISEVLSLTLDDVIQNGQIVDSVTVKRSNMKGKLSSRTVVLHNRAKEALKEYFNDVFRPSLQPKARSPFKEDKVFRISRYQAHRVLAEAKTKAQIQGKVSTHSCRKTFAHKVYEKTGRNIVAVQQALGHRSLASTSHYLNVNQALINAAILGD